MFRQRNYFKIIWPVLALIALARGWGLWHRGLMEHDEGHALLNANTWWHVLRWALGGGLWGGEGGGSIAELRDTLHQQGGTLYSAGKLGYSLLVAAVGLPGQVSTGLAMALAWLAGCAVAALAALLAWQYSRSRTAAIITAGGCLTSPLLIELSREASGTIWALVCGLAGALVINSTIKTTQARRRWILGLSGGALLGYGFACHFNLAPFILAVYLAAALFAWPTGSGSGAPFQHIISKLLPAALGGLGMLALFEAVTRAADYVLRNSYPEFLPFSGELHRLFFRDQVPMLDGVLYGDGAIGWSLQAWSVYGHALLREGPAWLCIMVFLVILAVWRGATRRRTPAINPAIRIAPALALLLVPALFWAAYIYRVERSLGMCMAASWIVIGIVFGPVIEQQTSVRSSRRMATLVMEILAFMQLAAGGIALVQLSQLKSPIPRLVSDTFASPAASGRLITAGSFDVTFAPLWKWAIVEHQRNGDPTTGPHVDFSRFEGAEIVFIDPRTWHRPNPEFQTTPQAVEAGRLIAAKTSVAPPWTIKSVAITNPR